MSKRSPSQISGVAESQNQAKRPNHHDLRYDERSQPSLPYPTTTRSASRSIPFQQPTQLLSFSHDSTHALEWSDSSLRYYTDPPLGADLNYAYERWIKRPETKPRIDSLLQAVSRLTRSSQINLPDIGVVSWRGVMTRILTAPYDNYDPWELNVMFVNGTLFFEEHVTDAKLEEKENMEPRHRKQTYYGYAFESYCTTDSPLGGPTNRNTSEPPGWSGDVNTNVQWCSVVRTKLGNTRMVIGGEVDCVRGKYTHQPDTFVELKTSMAIRHNADEAKFEKKLLKFYFQSFLLGVPEIVVGFRTPSGILTTTQTFKTVQIPRLVRGKPGAWNPSICLEWGSQFLSFLKEEIQKELGASDRDHTVWRVKFVPRSGISITVLDSSAINEVGDEGRVGFLPKEFWEEIHVASEQPTTQGNQEPSTPVVHVGQSAVAGWQI